MAERAARFAAAGAAPQPPRVAATVVLLRSAGGEERACEPRSPGQIRSAGRSGFEVYAIRRAATMAFGGMYAFPGGRVDPLDADTAMGWVGPGPSWWADRLRLPVGQARAVVCAAAREVFEEAGVLLAGPTADTVVADAGTPHWEAARRALVARERPLTELLAAAGLQLRSDLLVPWSRWITPEFEPRRFDTYFFVALLPEGQATRDVSGEADHTMWIDPADAVRGHAVGEVPMLPPTVVTLGELAGCADPPAVLAAAERRDPSAARQPRIVRDADGVPRLVVARLPH
jgi:8-oxo-dGTP pyrophosphatase MutT (NUDIX family)